MEVKYLAHHKQLLALEQIPRIAAHFTQLFGRASGGLLRTYRTEGAQTIVVALGSINGTIQEAVDALRAEGMRIGSVTLTAYRPFPLAALRAALAGAAQVVVIEKALAVGIGGILSTDVRMALAGTGTLDYTVIAGLGGRVIPRRSLEQVFRQAAATELDAITFLDLNWDVVERQLARESAERRSGPTAENILRDLGAVGSRLG